MRTSKCSFHSTLQNKTNFNAFLFRTRNEAKELIDATNQKTNNTQNEVTERLGGRVQDISYWKFELERAISDISAENDLMVQEIRRLEYAVQATDVPKNIANDCLGNRQRRIDTDLVQDNTENQILKELETISGVKATLTECLRNARDQLTASREAKHNLEMDWSDKVFSYFYNKYTIGLRVIIAILLLA